MDTFPNLFFQQCSTRKSDFALRYKHFGLWKTLTWGESETIVREFACGLASKGLKPNEKVAIIGNNVWQLYLAMISVQCLGAIPVPIHPDSNSKELTDCLNNCEAKFAITQDQQQVDGCYAVKEQCQNFEQMVYCDGRGMREYTSSRLHDFNDVREAGRKFASDHPTFFEDVSGKVTQESDAFIIYTAGTSGKSQGVVHTHASLIQTGKSLADQENIQQDEEMLTFLPLSYIANIMFGYTLWLLKGFTLSFPESNETIMNDFREIGPTILYAPPHFYKQLYAEIIGRSQRSGTKWFDIWFAVARNNREKFLNGEKLTTGDNFKWHLGNLLMYSPLKNVFGLSNLRKAFSGGDIMSGQVFNFLRSIGVHMKKVYGTTESAGLISIQGWEQLNTPAGEFIMGKPISGVEVKRLENGELAFKGINAFKGYYRNPEATGAIKTEDGWIKTGDMGDLDPIGAVRVTERVDSIGSFSSGETFAPHLIENALKSSPFIKEALAVGAGKDAVGAIIVIDDSTVGSWAEMNNVRFTGYRDLATKEEVYNLVKGTVEDVNAHIDTIEGKGSPPIKSFLIMHREFNIEAGEMTRSRKIRRDVVMDKHQLMVDALYSSQPSFEVRDSSSGEVLAEIRIQTT